MELTGLIARAKDVDGAGVSLPWVLTSVKTNLLEKIESRAGAVFSDHQSYDPR